MILFITSCTVNRAPTVQYVYTTNTQTQHTHTGISFAYDHSNLYGVNTISAKLFIDGNEVWSTTAPRSSTMKMQLPPREHIFLYEISSFNPVGAFFERTLSLGGSMMFTAKFELDPGQVGIIKCNNVPLCTNRPSAVEEKLRGDYEYDAACTIVSKSVKDVKDWDASMDGQFCPPGPFLRY